jgi:hypothetical protein
MKVANKVIFLQKMEYYLIGKKHLISNISNLLALPYKEIVHWYWR